jgi:hypothetical protein
VPLDRGPLPPLAALFATDGYRAPRATADATGDDGLDQWELALEEGREYGLSGASGQIQIAPPAY